MAHRRTTRCCSAVALIAAGLLASGVCTGARSRSGPLPFWPVRPAWTLALNNQITQPPAFDDENGYFAIEHDRLAAYAIGSGARLWLVDAAPQSAPAAGGGRVFFVQHGEVTALNASDGSPAWSSPLADELAVPPVWNSGWLMLATSAGSLVALRADDGHEIWRRDLGIAAHAPPAISGDRVYVPAANNRVLALQIETGAPLWVRRLGGAPRDILALDDRLFVGATDNYFYALTTDEGRVDWRWRTGADAIGAPVADDRRVYFTALDNVVRALNRSNGVQQWMQVLKLRPIGGPLKAGATVLVYGVQPPLRAFSAEDGRSIGDIPLEGELAAPPQLFAAGDQVPAVVVVTRDIAKGATVTLLRRSVEPQASPLLPLPNPITAVPKPAP